jgi:hypothetical protein
MLWTCALECGPNFCTMDAFNLQSPKFSKIRMPFGHLSMHSILPAFHLNWRPCCHRMAMKLKETVAKSSKLKYNFHLNQNCRSHMKSRKKKKNKKPIVLFSTFRTSTKPLLLSLNQPKKQKKSLIQVPHPTSPPWTQVPQLQVESRGHFL